MNVKIAVDGVPPGGLAQAPMRNAYRMKRPIHVLLPLIEEFSQKPKGRGKIILPAKQTAGAERDVGQAIVDIGRGQVVALHLQAEVMNWHALISSPIVLSSLAELFSCASKILG